MLFHLLSTPMQRLLVLFLFLTALSASGQQINGYWKGRLVMEPGGCFPVYNIEFQLQVDDSKIRGNSYHYSDTSNYVKEEFEGKFDTATKALNIQELKVSIFKIPADCIPCIKNYTLTYHTDGREEQLRGSWTGKTMDGKTACPSGSIVMTRIQKSAFTPPLPPDLANKKTELVREIFVDTGTIRLDFYDNGQIDGDTISVYVDNIPVVLNKMLSTKPVTVFIKIDFEVRQQEVIMVGKNLGTIPPNTALMIAHTAEKRYQLNLISDEKKNSMVRFIYQKPK